MLRGAELHAGLHVGAGRRCSNDAGDGDALSVSGSVGSTVSAGTRSVSPASRHVRHAASAAAQRAAHECSASASIRESRSGAAARSLRVLVLRGPRRPRAAASPSAASRPAYVRGLAARRVGRLGVDRRAARRRASEEADCPATCTITRVAACAARCRRTARARCSPVRAAGLRSRSERAAREHRRGPERLGGGEVRQTRRTRRQPARQWPTASARRYHRERSG